MEEKSQPGCSTSFVILPFQDGEEVNGNASRHEEAAEQQQDCDMIDQQPQNLPTSGYQQNRSRFSRTQLLELANKSTKLFAANSRVESLEKIIKCCNAKIAQYEIQNLHATQKNEDLIEDNKIIEEENNFLKMKNEDANKQIKHLESQLEEVRMQKDKLKEDNAKLGRKLENVTCQLMVKEKELQNMKEASD